MAYEVLAALVLALTVSCGPAPAPAAMPSAAPGPISPEQIPSPQPSALPSPATVPSPAPSAAPTVTPSPAPTPNLKYRFVPRLPADPKPEDPLIYAVYLNEANLAGKGPILIRVITNDAVTKVTSGSSGQYGVVPHVAPGVFYAASKLPGVPFPVSINLIVTAYNADGKSTSVKVPVKIH